MENIADNQRTVRIALKGYDDLPEQDRPALIYRLHTARQSAQMADLFGEAQKATTGAAWMASLKRAALVGLVGWENLRDEAGAPLPCDDLEEIDRALTTADLNELVLAVPEASMLKAIELKKSSLPSPSDTGASAGDAATAAPKLAAPACPASTAGAGVAITATAASGR